MKSAWWTGLDARDTLHGTADLVLDGLGMEAFVRGNELRRMATLTAGFDATICLGDLQAALASLSRLGHIYDGALVEARALLAADYAGSDRGDWRRGTLRAAAQALDPLRPVGRLTGAPSSSACAALWGHMARAHLDWLQAALAAQRFLPPHGRLDRATESRLQECELQEALLAAHLRREAAALAGEAGAR